MVVVDKGPIKTGVSGGAGCDHWNYPLTTPFSKITPEELVDFVDFVTYGWFCGIGLYIQRRESWDCLLDAERWGLSPRDVDDESKGSGFRDEETGILFAYNHDNRHNVRVRGGARIKEYYHRELRRLGVPLYERVMATSLLTEGGKEGARVVGATGLNVRTGEFYIFKAKSTVLCMSIASSPWIFSTESMGAGMHVIDPDCTGEGFSVAWNAGAELTLPLYDDLPGIPEDERRAIFGLMVGNEGRTRVPIYENYSQWGFDPHKDLLPVPIHPADRYKMPAWLFSKPPERYRGPVILGGGLMYDWDLKTNLEGLYVAGMNGFCGIDHSQAAATGRYAGRKAADYALREAPAPAIHRDQVEREKAKGYGPIERDNGMERGPRGCCYVMQ